MVVRHLELLLHSTSQYGSILSSGYSLCFVLGSLVSSHLPKNTKVGVLSMLNCQQSVNEGVYTALVMDWHPI